MLKELTRVNTEKGESSTVNVLHKNDDVTIETCSSSSETTSDEEIDNSKRLLVNSTIRGSNAYNK